MNKKGYVDPVITPALAVFAIVAVSFVGTIIDGTASKQVQKMKDAHNAPITVDKDVNGNGGNFK